MPGLLDGVKFIPELWALDVLETTEENLIMANLVTRFDDMAQEGGDVIHVPKAIKAHGKSETKTVPINISNHKEIGFLIEDILAIQSRSSLREIYTKRAGYAIAKAIDSHLASLYAGLSQSISVDGIDKQIITDALAMLDNSETPEDDRFLVVCPNLKNSVQSIKDIGCKVFASSFINSTMDQPSIREIKHNLMFQKGAFALAIQLGPRVQANYVPEYLSTLVTVDVIYGYATLNEKFAVDIQTLNSGE
jgi:hypothetical protein